MIVRATAIPLAYYPYSSTSLIVHWLTRNQGKISTLLKGAYRTKNRFLGEHELFSTTELLYYAKRSDTLYTAKECSMLQRRSTFRTDWRAMQTASYISALFNKTTPEEAPHPELFELYEELLDLAEKFGRHPQFLIWSELQFCDHHGHAPYLDHCLQCSADKDLRFCSAQGGVVCGSCSKEKKLPTVESPPDVLAILCAWQLAEHPSAIVKTQITGQQLTALNAILTSFMKYQFNLQPHHRNAALQAA
ncbi:MAG: DNA repair protein RecO [Pontiella sp.]